MLDLQPLEVDRAEILAGFLLGAQGRLQFSIPGARGGVLELVLFGGVGSRLGGGAKVPRKRIRVHGADARVDGADGDVAFEFERLALGVGDARVRLFDARAEVVEFSLAVCAGSRELVLDRLELGVDHGVALEDGEGAGSDVGGGAGARFLLGAARGSLRAEGVVVLGVLGGAAPSVGETRARCASRRAFSWAMRSHSAARSSASARRSASEADSAGMTRA